ncbi:hypothetical protein P9J64_17265 [Deltaproteobacteria bacterium IMCC39524]|nr:hypothetical protein [Deltaproteobacteria bacterium IMCC39524]
MDILGKGGINMHLVRFAALMMLVLFSTQAHSATFSDCYLKTCVFVTVPDNAEPGVDFDVKVEGYIEDASSFDVSAYMLVEDAEWDYAEETHMVSASGLVKDAVGFYWGGSITNTYTFNYPDGNHRLTFVFGPRSSSHGYYDVAVDAEIAIGSPVLNVAFDVKPQRCPNPLNVEENGIMTAAIVGFPGFDVMTVDTSTIQVAGISPIHIAYEDVAEPYYPLVGKTAELDCNSGGLDGVTDLVIKFKTHDVFLALQEFEGRLLEDGENVLAVMNAELYPTDGSTSGSPVYGEDIIHIIMNNTKSNHVTTNKDNGKN